MLSVRDETPCPAACFPVAFGIGALTAQFSFAKDTSFGAAAKATDTTAFARDGAKAAATVKAAFAARGITF